MLQERRFRPSEVPTPEREETSRLRVVVLLGVPTSGKSSHASRLEKRLDARIVRGREVVPGSELETDYESRRDLIPDEVFLPHLADTLTELEDGDRREELIVFDNIPRTVPQAEMLNTWSQEAGISLYVIHLSLSQDQVLRRAQERLVCSYCRSTYHPELKPSEQQGVCDQDGVQLTKRPGDDGEIVVKGYQDHQNRDRAVLEALEKTASVRSVDVSGPVDDAHTRVLTVLTEMFDDEPDV